MYLDSRELIDKREELQNQILSSFNETFPQYETDDFDNILFEEGEIDSWKEVWQDEINEITCIDELENEVSSSEWEYGITFVKEDNFQEYCEDLIKDVGDLPDNLPSYIANNIDWEGVADDISVDYSEVEYQGVTYLFRS